MSFEQRVAVITGATGGLGRVVARDWAKEGVRLALIGTHLDRLTALAEGIGAPTERVAVVEADLTQAETARRAAQTVLQRFGRVDMLLHFVGGWAGGKAVVDVEASVLEDMVNQHLWSTFHTVQAFVPALISNGWGRIVVISSPSAQTPPARGLPYSAGKAAQEALIATLAEELKDTGVTANVLRVKSIDVRHEREQAPSAKNASWTTPEEIAATLRHLCTDEAGVINGARLPLYGAP